MLLIIAIILILLSVLLTFLIDIALNECYSIDNKKQAATKSKYRFLESREMRKDRQPEHKQRAQKEKEIKNNDSNNDN